MLVVQGLWFQPPDRLPPPLSPIDPKQVWWFGLAWPQEDGDLPHAPPLLQDTLACLKNLSGRPGKRLLRPSKTSDSSGGSDAAIRAWAAEAQKARVEILAWPLPKNGRLEATLVCLRSAFRGQIAWIVDDLSSLETVLPSADPDLWLLQTSLPAASSPLEWQAQGRLWRKPFEARSVHRPLLIWLEALPLSQTAPSIFAAFQPHRSDILGFLLPSS